MAVNSDLKSTLEAVLFASASKLSLDDLARLCRTRDVSSVLDCLKEIQSDHEIRGSPLLLFNEGASWRFVVRERFVPFVRKLVTKTELSKSVIETLAIVASRAPVLQSDVIRIRTNKAYDHLDKLEENGYLSREKTGRTKMIRLADKFFEYFDVLQSQIQERFSGVREQESLIESQESRVEDRLVSLEDQKSQLRIREDERKRLESEELSKLKENIVSLEQSNSDYLGEVIVEKDLPILASQNSEASSEPVLDSSSEVSMAQSAVQSGVQSSSESSSGSSSESSSSPSSASSSSSFESSSDK